MFAAVAAAFEAVDVADLEDRQRWPDQVLRVAVVEAERVASRLRAVQARLVAEATRRDLAGGDGCASPGAWLSRQAGLSGGEAARRLDEARAVASSPEVAAALERGEITAEHARTIGSTLRAEPAMSAAELLDHARASDAGRFAHRAGRLRRAHQGDGGLSQFEAQRRARSCSVWVRPDDGMVVVHAELDPLDGARVRARLLAEAERLWRADLGDAADPGAGERTNAQRTADALVQLCAAGESGASTGSVGLVEVEVLVTIDHATLVGDGPGSAEVLGVGPIPAATARRMACDAGVIPVVLGGEGETLDVGRRRRLATRAQRRALHRHHGHCAWDGCTAPFEWCQIHHLEPWTSGGRTDLANLVPLCHAHHHLAHEGGWTVRPAPGMTITAHPPQPPPRPPDLAPQLGAHPAPDPAG